MKKLFTLIFLLNFMCSAMETAPEQEAVVTLRYQNKEIELPLSTVKISKTLANCMQDAQNTSTICFDDVLNISMDDIDQLHNILKACLGEQPTTDMVCTPSVFRLIEWLDLETSAETVERIYSTLPDDKKGEKKKSYNLNSKKIFSDWLANSLDHASDEIDEDLIIKFQNKLAFKEFLNSKKVEWINESNVSCGKNAQEIELTIRQNTADTFWGIHRLVTDQQARDSIKKLTFDFNKTGNNNLNLAYYVKLFPHLLTISVEANQGTYREGIYVTNRLNSCSLIEPLLPSITSHIKNIKQLTLLGVHFPERLALHTIIDTGKQLETLEMVSCRPIEETEESCTDDNTTLQTLCLKKLGLKTVPPCIKKLKELKRLNLANNKISHVAGSLFPERLQECNLGENKITSINYDAILPQCTLNDYRHIHANINTKILLLKTFSATQTKELF